MATAPMAIEARQVILEAEVQKYVRAGWVVDSRSETSAQLRKPKRLHFLLAVILLLALVVPFLVYLLWHNAQQDTMLYLTVDPQGKIQRR